MNSPGLLEGTTHSREESDYITLSSLNDAAFCRRRCALHRLENVWVDTVHTRSGSRYHERVHARRKSRCEESRKEAGLRLVSHAHGIQGVADLVEFLTDGTPFPVEYKRGKERPWDNDDVQLCAQALCLEEMTGKAVPSGAIYHILSKRRRTVEFSTRLRELTRETIREVRNLLSADCLPPVVKVPHCRKCSLRAVCMPGLDSESKTYKDLVDGLFAP